MTVTINTREDFTLEAYANTAWKGEAVSLGRQALDRMTQARAAFMRLLDEDPDVGAGGLAVARAGASQRERLVVQADEREPGLYDLSSQLASGLEIHHQRRRAGPHLEGCLVEHDRCVGA